MTNAPADAFDRYIGRYSNHLPAGLLALAGVGPGQRALDVGCGPGALTIALADIVGPRQVCAVDPSEAYVEACRQRVPGADVRVATAEALPFADDAFDVVLAQLVMNLLPDADAGLREMMRTTRPGGTVAASVWADDGMPLLLTFWAAARAVASEAVAALGETGRVGYGHDHFTGLWEGGGLLDVEVRPLEVTVEYADFEDLWEPIAEGAGRPGALCRSLDVQGQRALRREWQRRLGAPSGSFALTARAWCARGTAP